MTAMKNETNGLGGGLVVLRDVVSKSSFRGLSLNAKVVRPTSESCGMRVVSRNLKDVLED